MYKGGWGHELKDDDCDIYTILSLVHSHTCPLCSNSSSNMRSGSGSGSGREHRGGYDPPLSHGIDVLGRVRQHNKAGGYGDGGGGGDGLRDGGGRTVDLHMPVRERERELGEISEFEQLPSQGPDAPPIIKVIDWLLLCCWIVLD